MWKQKFYCRTEDETFHFSANPMHIRQAAAVILAQHGVKFAEISDMEKNVLMIVSYNSDREPDQAFTFAFPETQDNEI